MPHNDRLEQGSKPRQKDFCQDSILELLRSNSVQLKSRKFITVNNCKMEEIVFIKPFKRNEKTHNINPDPVQRSNTPDLLESPISFSSVELSIKEYIQDFVPVTREMVGTANSGIYQKTIMFTAFHNITPSSTAELCQAETHPTGLLGLIPLDAEPHKTDYDISTLKSVKNDPEIIWDTISSESYKSKENMFKIYSYLKTIESLTKIVPKTFL